jgi:hypothetical protein
MPEQHPPSAFEEIFASPERPIIVGGQAVNLWAEHYSQLDPFIKTLGPFVSKDADIFGTRDLAERLAATSRWQLTNYYEPRTVALAVLRKELSGKEPLIVEVIGSVNGLANKDLVAPDILEIRPGQIYRVPSPVILLKAKLANVANIDQTQRQDVRHVRILIPCVRQYLADALERTKAGQISERSFVNLLEASRELCTTPRNLELALEHHLELDVIFPSQLAHSDLEKISNFVRFRLPGKIPEARSTGKEHSAQSQEFDKNARRELDIEQGFRPLEKKRDFEIKL